MRISIRNALVPTIIHPHYLAENIVYDKETKKYWWIFTDRSKKPWSIRLASAVDIEKSWIVEKVPVITEGKDYLDSPCLKKFNNYWYIYYARHPLNTPPANIYVQKSLEVNKNYNKKDIKNPIITCSNSEDWDHHRVTEPYVFKIGNLYYIFFMGENEFLGVEKTGYAISLSPKGPFEKFKSNPILNGDHGWDSGNDKAADPFVFKDNDKYWIGVSACSSGKQGWRIGFYWTKDFQKFNHYSKNPVLNPGKSWDSFEVFRGAVSVFDNKKYLTYCGVSEQYPFEMGKTILTMEN